MIHLILIKVAHDATDFIYFFFILIHLKSWLKNAIIIHTLPNDEDNSWQSTHAINLCATIKKKITFYVCV